MEFIEPKVGDRIFHGSRITTIQSFSEDSGTHLRSGEQVCISEFTKYEDDVWRRPPAPRTYEIGETYRNIDLRKGVAVIRPAVFVGSLAEKHKVVTTSPCCKLYSRRLDFNDLNSDLAAKKGGWTEQCTSCKAYYKVSLAYNESPRLGLYGVRWEAEGH